ncbi:hypothetical protein [Haloplanus natans]|uniref:hypothetical protein n=1 Tax=Haloplanus natans TaxID=376171 RepID=UPI0006778C21|nr:hypothetical protein [Haloplanus natans]
MFVVEIKTSAIEPGGKLFKQIYTENRSRRREFDSESEADNWADGLDAVSSRKIYLQSSNDLDDPELDAYLIGQE